MKKNIILTFFIIGCVLTACGSNKDKKTEETETTNQSTEIQIATTTDVTSNLTIDGEGFYVTDDYVVTVGDTINVRISPSTDASIYSLLGGGEVLKRTGYNDEWTRVILDNTNFYIHSDLVEITDAPPEPETVQEETATDTDAEKVMLDKIIVIDPGNQANPNMSQEAIAPDSDVTKQCATSGNVGATLGTKEYELNLRYANALKDELESRGYQVALTRDNNDIDISNQSRALFANSSGATTFIRIQMNYSTNKELSGVMAVTMTSDSPYNSELYSDSNVLATRILQGITAKTGALNHGIYETNEMTAINWSDIPVVVINLGYLSNEQDENNLLEENYFNNIVTGFADGIDYFYNN